MSRYGSKSRPRGLAANVRFTPERDADAPFSALQNLIFANSAAYPLFGASISTEPWQI
jgi:hypothetical protein